MKKITLGSIFVIATPIGNSEDITIRALRTLEEVDAIACEDTRITSKLCNIHKINCKGKLISYHEHNSHKMIPVLIQKIKSGIWTFAGNFYLNDSSYETIDNRKVFKFMLDLIEEKTSPSSQSNKKSPGRLIPSSVKFEVYQRDKGRCVDCGETTDLHYDHILPYSKGGSSTTSENIQLLCARHNLSKSNKII